MNLKGGHWGRSAAAPVEPSGGRCLGVVDGLEELFTGLVEPPCGVMVAQCAGEFVEALEGEARGEVALSVGQ